MRVVNCVAAIIPASNPPARLSSANSDRLTTSRPPIATSANRTLAGPLRVNADRAAIGDCARLRYHLEQGFAETLSVV